MAVTAVLRACAVLLLSAVVALAVAIAPAHAHSDLRSSDPADGAVLTGPPAQVSFTFNEDLLDQGNAITVTELATDTRLAVGPVQVDASTVSVAWPEASPAGDYRAAYRVVSADGHPIDGTITFTVSEPAGSAAASAAGGQASAQPSAVGADPTLDPAAEPLEQASTSAAMWALIFGVLALIGAAAATWHMRRSR